MIPLASTFRTRRLPQSPMKRLPAASTATPVGVSRRAWVAGPPSPVKPLAPLPGGATAAAGKPFLPAPAEGGDEPVGPPLPPPMVAPIPDEGVAGRTQLQGPRVHARLGSRATVPGEAAFTSSRRSGNHAGWA